MLKEYIDKDQLFELVYSVGSIYLSTAANSPTDLFGIGEQEKIKDTFLLASGNKVLGESGGTDSHSHNYGIKYGGYYKNTIIEKNPNAGLLDYSEDNTYSLSTEKNLGNLTDIQVNASAEPTYASVSVAHYEHIASTSNTSNLPPYLVINVWKRVN